MMVGKKEGSLGLGSHRLSASVLTGLFCCVAARSRRFWWDLRIWNGGHGDFISSCFVTGNRAWQGY